MYLWRIYPYLKTTESVENPNISNLKMKKKKVPLLSLKVAVVRGKNKQTNNPNGYSSYSSTSTGSSHFINIRSHR